MLTFRIPPNQGTAVEPSPSSSSPSSSSFGDPSDSLATDGMAPADALDLEIEELESRLAFSTGPLLKEDVGGASGSSASCCTPTWNT